MNNQYASQELRKDNYDQKIKDFTIAAATNFNEQVSRDLANFMCSVSFCHRKDSDSLFKGSVGHVTS